MPRGFALLAVFAVLTSVAGCTLGEPDSRVEGTTGTAGSLEQDYQAVVADILPSIVEIVTEDGLGSGIVYDNDGHIVTNAHVVGDATRFEVTPAAGGSPVPAKLVAAYPPDDLAVIKVDGDFGPVAAIFADSSAAQVGQLVLAIGNPLGLNGSVTDGIVSATGRTVTEPKSEGSPETTITDMIQTTAAINPGNSGGALVNLAGEVIGIPTLAATIPEAGGSVAPGIGFAVSSNTVTRVADQIITEGAVSDSGRAALGIRGRTVVDQTLSPLGVAVVERTPEGAAETAGIAVGDLIVAIDDAPVTTMTSLNEYVATRRPGDKVEVTIERGDSQNALSVTLGEL